MTGRGGGGVELSPRDRRAAWVVVLGAAVFALAVLAVPVLEGGGYSATRDSISEGALGRFGPVQTVAFVVLAVTSLALVDVVARCTSGRLGAVAAVLLGLWSAGVLLSAVFEVDPGADGDTTQAQLHFAAALTAFVSGLGAAWLTSFAVRRDPDHRGAFRWSVTLAALSTVAFLVTGYAQQATSWGGVAQRVFVALLLGWMAAVAVSLSGERPPRHLGA